LKVSEIEKDNQLAEQAKAGISKTWSEIKKKPEVTAYENIKLPQFK